MTFIQVMFYVLSAMAIGSGLMVVASRNSVHGALCLVLTFVCMAAIWMLLQAEFLALILVLVYVGAVMTLFLFVVMMLSVNRITVKEGFVRYLPLCLLIVLAVVGLIVMAIGPERFGLAQMPVPPEMPVNYNNMASLGEVLYTQYAFPFEVAAVLLLTAIVAAINLTHRKRPKMHKTQNIPQQIAVKAKDRVKLVNISVTEGKQS